MIYGPTAGSPFTYRTLLSYVYLSLSVGREVSVHAYVMRQYPRRAPESSMKVKVQSLDIDVQLDVAPLRKGTHAWPRELNK